MAPKKRKPGPPPVYKMKVSTPGSYSMDQIRKLSTIGQLSTSDFPSQNDDLSAFNFPSNNDEVPASDPPSQSDKVFASDSPSHSKQVSTSDSLSTSDIPSQSDVQTSTSDNDSHSQDKMGAKSRAPYMTKSRKILKNLKMMAEKMKNLT